MLAPDKHLKLHTSLLHLAALALDYLHRYRSVTYAHLYAHLERKVGRHSDDLRVMFGPTLSFLYLMEKLRYHPQNDTFEYLESQQIER